MHAFRLAEAEKKVTERDRKYNKGGRRKGGDWGEGKNATRSEAVCGSARIALSLYALAQHSTG